MRSAIWKIIDNLNPNGGNIMNTLNFWRYFAIWIILSPLTFLILHLIFKPRSTLKTTTHVEWLTCDYCGQRSEPPHIFNMGWPDGGLPENARNFTIMQFTGKTICGKTSCRNKARKEAYDEQRTDRTAAFFEHIDKTWPSLEH